MNMVQLRRNKRLLLCLLLFAISIVGLLRFGRRDRAAEVIKYYEEVLKRARLTSAKCTVPALDPFDKSILSYYEKPSPLKCNAFQSNISYIENGHLKLNMEKVSGSCEYRYALHNEGISDLVPRHTEWWPYKEPVKLENDVVEVRCRKSSILPLFDYSYVWSHVVARDTSLLSGKKIEESEPDKHPSLIIVGLDSMSLSNFVRQLPKTYARLGTSGFHVMRKHVKIADNTYGNMLAFLTGKRGNPTAQFHVELDDRWNIAFDDFPIIWKDFSERGYATFFSEDRPEIGTFNYFGKLKGFLRQPTDHYHRPYWLSFADSLLFRRSSFGCYDTQPLHKLMFGYLQSFLDAYTTKRKFAFLWTQNLSHDFLNKIGVVDEDLDQFFEQNTKQFEEAVVVVISDHGHRYDTIRETSVGRFEARLPFLAIRLPTSLRERFPDLERNLAENSAKMTTQFDVYATFRHILEANFNETALPKETQRAYSLFGRMPEERSCFEANIPDDYCPCIQEVALSEDAGLEPALQLLRYVNRLAHESADEFSPPNTRCVVLELDEVKEILMRVPPQKLLIDPQVDNQSIRDSKISYRVVLKAKDPSNAILEAIMTHDLAGQDWITGEIERNNRYGNSSYCVRNPILKKTCHCISV